MLGCPVHRLSHALLLGDDIVEGVSYDLVGFAHLFEVGAAVLLGLGELVEQFLELGSVVLDLALERAERVPVEVLGALQRLLRDCLVFRFCTP